MRSPVVFLLCSLFISHVFAANNTDTTTFKPNSRNVASFTDQYGKSTEHIPCPCRFDSGQYFYTQSIDIHDYTWSCKVYDNDGVCLDLSRSPRPTVKLYAFIHDRNDDSKIQADLISIYNSEHEQKIDVINLSSDRKARNKYNVSTLPVIVMLRGDKEIARKTGLETRENMSNWIKHELSQP